MYPDQLDAVIGLLGVLATLAILSVVYKENPFYRFFEHLFIGVATGWGIVVTWRDVLRDGWFDPLWHQGHWWLVLPPLVAALYYTVYSPKHAWLSRMWITILFGLGAGLSFKAFATQIFPQIEASWLPVVPQPAEMTGGDPISGWTALGNAVFLITLISVMVYFFFSFRHAATPIRATARLGRWLLMVAFGATFGSTVMARFSLLIDRLDFLIYPLGGTEGTGLGADWGLLWQHLLGRF